jgi:hypothetical protein
MCTKLGLGNTTVRKILPFVLVVLVLYGWVADHYNIPSKLLYSNGSFSQGSDQTTETVQSTARRFNSSLNENEYDNESDGAITFFNITLGTRENVLVRVDVWTRYPNDDWLQRSENVTHNKILSLIQLASEHHVLVAHVLHGQGIVKEEASLSGECVVDSPNAIHDNEELDTYLRPDHIKTLPCAGNATNLCVLFARQVGP